MTKECRSCGTPEDKKPTNGPCCTDVDGRPFFDQGQLEDLIEGAIDEYGIGAVIDAVASVCLNKAMHIRESYDDSNLSQLWADVGLKINKIDRRTLP